MSVFTYVTAPSVIGTLYLAIRKRVSLGNVYLAICLWMFSTSWSYDLYIVLRDGNYPVTWTANIFASAVLYVSAGMMWNLDWRINRGLTFSFLEEGWPNNSAESQFAKVAWVALPFILLVAVSALYFVIPNIS
jgi:hypothetical protein